MIEKAVLERVIAAALSRGATFADVFVEETYASRLSLLDRRIDRAASGFDVGAGVRAFFGTRSVYGYTNDLSEAGLLRTAEAVARAGAADAAAAPSRSIGLVAPPRDARNPVRVLPDTVAKSDKAPFLARVDAAARRVSDLVTQVEVTLGERIQRMVVANSEGLLAGEDRCYVRLGANAIATRAGARQSAFRGPGGFVGLELLDSIDPEALGTEIAESAVRMVNADYAPAGRMPVVIGSDFGGVIFHEACGHGLETTAVAKGASVFCGKLGEPVATEIVTAVDDGQIPSLWGSIALDDEGLETRRTVLIENGLLKSYMVDRLGGLKTGYAPTGSARRESYRFPPTSRMRNTYIAAGTHDLGAMLASTEFGLYAKRLGGGSVTPGTGDFNFAVEEGWLIEKGKLTKPVRGATLIGSGAEVLKKIDMVGRDLQHTAGMCGSVSGQVPVTVGQPTIKVREIVVGGRK